MDVHLRPVYSNTSARCRHPHMRSSLASYFTMKRGPSSRGGIAIVLALTFASAAAVAQQAGQVQGGNCNEVSMVVIAPGNVLGSLPSTGTVTLRKAARAGGQHVQLASDDSTAAIVPASIEVPAGAVTAQFAIQTSPVATDTHVFISAFCGSDRKHAARYQISVRPPRLQAIELANALRPGGKTYGKVTLNGPAPAGGFTVLLQKGAYLSIPDTVVVPAGQTEALFEVRAENLTVQRTAGFTGRAGGSVVSASTRLDPQAPLPPLPTLSNPQSAPLAELKAEQRVMSLSPEHEATAALIPAGYQSAASIVSPTASSTSAPTAQVQSSAVKALEAKPGFGANPLGFVAYSPAPGVVQLEWGAVDGAVFYWLQGPGLPTPLKTQLTFSKIVDVPAGTHTYTLLSVFAQDIAPDESNPSKATVAVTESAETAIERAYADGRQKFGAGPDPDAALWKATARATGAAYNVLLESFQSIWLVAYAYHHLLGRLPDTEGAARYIGQLNTGTPWTNVWREIAHSSEREQKYGYWAPAPMDSVDDARATFGNSLVHAETCFGGIGDQCDTADVGQPTWSTAFRLPDGTLMAYVTANVEVGSILHDNACVASKGTGYYCDQALFASFVATDLLSSVDPRIAAAKAAMPAVLEWNKAVYNSVQKRLWRETFGPYPVHRDTRRKYWYDDVRPTPARKAHMAPMFGVITAPMNVIPYSGLETKSSRRLSAPSQTWLDIGDEDFCTSKKWSTNLILWAQCK